MLNGTLKCLLSYFTSVYMYLFLNSSDELREELPTYFIMKEGCPKEMQQSIFGQLEQNL